ncbi:MAG: peptidylprolyl isomerase [Brevinematales bacterium]|nr:peptidylprolyl isomerase [Brevinematales bacterium]
MKRIIFAMLALVTFSCSLIDEKVIASYGSGKMKGTVKIKDVKADFLNYALYDQSIVSNDVNWYKELIRSKFVIPELQYIDLVERGITNSTNFISNFQKMEKNIYDGTLIRKGQEIITEISKKGKHNLARASHILFLVSKYTNVNGKQIEKSEQEYQKELQEIEKKAVNLLDSLKQAKNLDKEFAEAAKNLSEDPGSKNNGGDLGYFTEGTMVKEFEDAVFNAKKKGLVETPVKTPYGFHIIYVKEPASKKSLSQIKSKVDKNSYSRIERTLSYKFMDSYKQEKVKDLFESDYANKKIVLDGNSYEPKDIPDNAKVVEVYGKPYSWSESKEIISFYIPNFIETLNFDNFITQMNNLKNFLFFRDIAKNKNYDKSAKFKKDVKDNIEKYRKNLVVQTYEGELFENSKNQIAEKDIIDYYNKNKEKFTKTEKNKKIIVPLKDAKESIINELAFQNLQTEKRKWEDELNKKYQIVFSDSAIKSLINMEKQNIQKFKREQQNKQPKRK